MSDGNGKIETEAKEPKMLKYGNRCGARKDSFYENKKYPKIQFGKDLTKILQERKMSGEYSPTRCPNCGELFITTNGYKVLVSYEDISAVFSREINNRTLHTWRKKWGFPMANIPVRNGQGRVAVSTTMIDSWLYSLVELLDGKTPRVYIREVLRNKLENGSVSGS